MARKQQAYKPSMADSAVKTRTGKDWTGWFATLDKAGAAKLDHKTIAKRLSEKHDMPGWWAQCITVEYELARGLRVRHQTATGFSVSVSKTIAASLPDLYAATATAARRRKWFPPGEFTVSSQTKDKYLNGSWNGNARLIAGFYDKGANKSQIALQINKLTRQADVAPERAAWKAAVSKLQKILEE